MSAEGVHVWRGSEIESRHEIHAATADDGGKLLAWAGDPHRRTFLRSAAKPIQLLPLIEDGLVARFGFTEPEIAVMTASHNGEDFHLEAVRSILAKAGLEPAQLKCGIHEPFHAPSAEALRVAGEKPSALHNNCSGKHAAMLVVCRARGWPLATYTEPAHPLQQRILKLLAEIAGMESSSIGVGVDGCSAPTFALPLSATATAFARLARADARRDDERSRAVGVVFDAMASRPEYVAGSGRLCTELMAKAGTRVVVKTGAEGVYVGALRGEGRGIALKIADGAKRAQDPALLALLEDLGALDQDTRRALESHATPPIVNRAGALVGRIEARISWTWSTP